MFLVPNVGDSTIEVYRRNDQTFELAATFDLPPQADGCTLHNANSRYKSRGVFRPSAAASDVPTERPFCLSAEKELVMLEYRAGDSRGDLHVHSHQNRRSFLFLTTEWLPLSSARREIDQKCVSLAWFAGRRVISSPPAGELGAGSRVRPQ